MMKKIKNIFSTKKQLENRLNKIEKELVELTKLSVVMSQALLQDNKDIKLLADNQTAILDFLKEKYKQDFQTNETNTLLN